MNNQDAIRPLTRKEQLEWLLDFYKKQKELLDIYEKEAQEEYKLLLKKGDSYDKK